MELKLYYLGEVSGMTKEQVEEAEKFIKGFEYGIIATWQCRDRPASFGLEQPGWTNIAATPFRDRSHHAEISEPPSGSALRSDVRYVGRRPDADCG